MDDFAGFPVMLMESVGIAHPEIAVPVFINCLAIRETDKGTGNLFTFRAIFIDAAPGSTHPQYPVPVFISCGNLVKA